MARFGERTRTSSLVSTWGNNSGGGMQWPTTVDRAAAITVTASSTTHTKGAWTELIASTSAACDLVMIYILNNSSGVATESLMDIGLGAAGSETSVVDNIAAGEITAAAGYRNDVVLPLSIGAGVRVAARLQSVASSRAAIVYVAFLSTGFTSPTSLDTIGAITATSRGTNLPTSNTYVELTASTSRAYKAIVMVPTAATNSTSSSISIYTLGYGVAGSETTIGTLSVITNAAEYTGVASQDIPFVRYINIPAGTRLAVKQSNGAAFRDVILYGVPA